MDRNHSVGRASLDLATLGLKVHEQVSQSGPLCSGAFRSIGSGQLTCHAQEMACDGTRRAGRQLLGQMLGQECSCDGEPTGTGKSTCDVPIGAIYHPAGHLGPSPKL
jgi:hypothetical protein